MKKYASADIRNIALISHGQHGTTSLADSMLYVAGTTTRLGSVDAGNSTFDYDEEARERKSSVSAGIGYCEYGGKKFNIVDLPGLADFVGDVDGALRAVDAVVLVVSAVDGVEVRTERLWTQAGERGLPRAIFINKMDRDRADFDRTVADVSDALGITPLALTTPIGQEGSFNGVINLLTNEALIYERDDSTQFEVALIPSDLAAATRAAREALVEDVAGTDEELMEHYFEEGNLDADTLRTALRPAFRTEFVNPLFVGSATMNIGVAPLMDFIATTFPTPLDGEPVQGVNPTTGTPASFTPDPDSPLSAYVFKTIADKYTGRLAVMRVYSGTLSSDTSVHNTSRDHGERIGSLIALQGSEHTQVGEAPCGDIVAVAKLKDTHTGDTLCGEAHIAYPGVETPPPAMTLAIGAERQGEEDKIYQALVKLAEEDPSLQLSRDPASGTLLGGMGQLHIDSTLRKLNNKFNLQANTSLPKIAYRETIRGAVTDVRYRHKKQTGGKGQFAEVVIDIGPNGRGEGYSFEDAIVGGAIPRGFIPAVDKGIHEVMDAGVLAGYPVVDINVKLHDGKYHDVDSSEMAFKIAARMAFKQAMRDPKARACLLEPIVELEIAVPEDAMGDVMGDLSSRRGRPMGMEARGRYQVIKAQAPEAEVMRYAPDLRSMTGGRGDFVKHFSHYEEVPRDIAEKLMASFTDDDHE